MKTYSFDEICESQDFDHDEKFVKYSEITEEIERRIEKAIIKEDIDYFASKYWRSKRVELQRLLSWITQENNLDGLADD